MRPLQPVCETVAKLVSQDVEKLKSYGIYYKIFNEKGEIVAKILFADYEKEANTSLKSYFEQKRFVAFIVNGEEDIMDVMLKERPDVVYLDAKLPSGKSGFETLKEIKQLDNRIKVIMVTVFDEDEMKEKVEDYGLSADAYMKKPCNLEMLESLINKLTSTGKRIKL